MSLTPLSGFCIGFIGTFIGLTLLSNLTEGRLDVVMGMLAFLSLPLSYFIGRSLGWNLWVIIALTALAFTILASISDALTEKPKEESRTEYYGRTD